MTLVPPAPSRPVTRMADFTSLCAERADRPFPRPADLHDWSIRDAPQFWRALLDWSGLPWSGSAEKVLVGEDVESARFFPDVMLNHAECLLRPIPGVDDDAPALTSLHRDRPAERLTRGQLRDRVRVTATALARHGLGAGDRVVAVAANNATTAVAGLAVTALGATLATASPDVGVPALLGRFEQVDPSLLVLDRTLVPGDADALAAALVAGLPTVRTLMILDDLALPAESAVPVVRLSALVDAAAGAPPAAWPRLPFDHPLFVLFSSGTTGPPKPIVHGAGGTVLEHVKELALHTDLGPSDVLYFHATTTWMVWNWLLSALACGAHVVTYDGPILGPDTLWRIVADEGVTVLGTSPAYLQLCQDSGYRPRDGFDLSRLKRVACTGSVLHEWQYDWVAEAVGPVPVQSVSGGTDIIGCFLMGHPELPVRKGRSQVRSLGMDVAAVDELGREVVGEIGDLVCRRPFPSRPVGFLRDPAGERFHRSYFVDHPGMWTHGDLVDFDTDGTSRVHGRSDGVLNVGGVRIGPSEIYRTLRELPQILEAMAVEQRDPARSGPTRMVLLVRLAEGAVLDAALDRTIRRVLREQNSAAHVPSLVVAVPELPTTHNGKPSERAARDAVNGDRVANEAALRNPECLAVISRAVLERGGSVPAPRAEATPEAAPAAAPVSVAAPRSPDELDAVEVDETTLRSVLALLQEHLNLADIRPDDDFFDLGGSSALLVHILGRVKVGLGADVDIREFLARPTPEGLARAVVSARRAGSSTVKLLRPGQGRPVYLVCDVLGQLNSFHTLVSRLDTERPVYGLAPEVSREDGSRRSIAEVALDVTEQLAQAHPEGAFSLLGYSFGGLVAYEAAHHLAGRGREIAFLGLIDVASPEAVLSPAEIRAKRWSQRLDKVKVDAPGTAVRFARRRLGRPVATDVQGDPEMASYQQVFDAHLPARYRGAVVYYEAREQLPVIGSQLAVWRRSAPNMMVTPIPGNHESLLAEPAVSEVAARISATLR
ncbi:acetoacetate--CoA ligase [Pseudonocardia xishanensis]|uniref:Carrier domain-containing protein n=1 Tax=Pseudonocardia xishanensis TaxID=630995 RepID=A0ABP8S2S1_9PSEU